MCRRNSSPSPLPSCAPRISPGMSATVGDELQLQAQAALPARPPLFELGRGLVLRRGEPGVAASALAASGDGEGLFRLRQVPERQAGFLIDDDRAGRHANDGVGAVGAVLFLGLAPPAVAAAELRLGDQVQEGAQIRVRRDDHVPAVAAVAAVRPAAGDVFLPPEAHASVPSVAPPDADCGLVDEPHGTPVPLNAGWLSARSNSNGCLPRGGSSRSDAVPGWQGAERWAGQSARTLTRLPEANSTTPATLANSV